MRYIKGTHLTIDGYVGCEEVFSQPIIFSLFNDLSEALNMTILADPVAVEVPIDESKLASDEDEGGVSYFCLITTSHMAIHVWPLRKTFMLDIFSCRPFDPSVAVAVVLKKLSVDDYLTNVIFRTDPKIKDKKYGLLQKRNPTG